MPIAIRSICARSRTCGRLTSKLRDEHGFRILDYSVDADAASPRACFQFSEDLPGKRTDFSPFVALEGTDKPAITTEEKQLCVEGLKHGERYSITLRAGLPSTVRETLQKSADYNIYVRDRSPYVRFTGKAYVLPRTGQRGIPVVSVNTAAVQCASSTASATATCSTRCWAAISSATSTRYERGRLGTEKGELVWKGELKIDSVLNADVTTAFPIDQAIGDLKARRLCDDGRSRRRARPAMTRATASSRRNGSSSPISG